MSEPGLIPGTVHRPPAIPVETRVPFAFVHINKCVGSSIEIALGIPKDHQPARAMRDAYGAEDWAQRFTFSIVRNPFERVTSIYYYRVRTDMTGLMDRHLNINQWIDKVWGTGDPTYLDDALLLGPAEDWLCEDGALLVDHVGRVETLDKDWGLISEKLGVDIALPVANVNAHPPYRDVLSGTARALIERAFAADLERFDYSW